jgi:glutaminyl-peptide cyclotransferase
VPFHSVVLAPLICAAVLSAAPAARPSHPPDGYRIVRAYPHDPNAFTQGLVFVDGHLYESTGLNGRSSLRMVDLQTGRVLQHHDLPPEYFGEGLTNWDGSLVQLTWKAGTAFVYDRFSFALQRSLHYAGEGWGLTQDGKSLIMSDGSPVLRFLDPRTFRELRRMSVIDENGQPVLNLNELEYIHGDIYANVWHTDRIARISPRTGKVLGWIDLSGLIDKSQLSDLDAVLNGIAYDSKWDRLFVTGKLWPKLFEIKVVRRPTSASHGRGQVPRKQCGREPVFTLAGAGAATHGASFILIRGHWGLIRSEEFWLPN